MCQKAVLAQSSLSIPITEMDEKGLVNDYCHLDRNN
jgi:hypothetical protein